MTAAPAQTAAAAAEPIHRHEHAHGAAHDHAPDAHTHVHRHHAHAHGPGRRHPAARPGFSFLRLSVWQRLLLVLPLAGLIWALALAVIWGGGA
jgi:ABC-type nickel/cobalt efflux system permease component RcnA